MRFHSFAAAALSALVALPALAQDINSTNYAEVRGWLVKSATDSQGFAGCWAVNQSNGNFISLALMLDGWQVWVPSDRTDAYDGGGIAVDNRPWTDSQFGFWPEGGAYANITPEMVAMIGAGSVLHTQINGDVVYDWSLSGSAAAITKIEECVDMQFGGASAAVAPATTAPAIAAPGKGTAVANACPAPGSVRSGVGVTLVPLTFGNGRNTALSLEWLDESGQRVPYATLQPGQTVDIDTYAEHRWLALAPDGSCPGGVIAPEPSEIGRYMWEIYAD